MIKSLSYKLLLFLILILSLSVFASEIYKWTDKDGNVVFGDSPPQDTDSSTIYKNTQQNTGNISSTNKERAKKQQKLLDSFAADRREKQQQQRKINQAKKDKKYNCEVAKDKVKRYKKASGIYVRDDVGQKTYLDKKQRKQEEQYMASQVKKWCK